MPVIVSSMDFLQPSKELLNPKIGQEKLPNTHTHTHTLTENQDLQGNIK